MTKLSDFKAHFLNNARPTQFRVNLQFPDYVPSDLATRQSQFLCKAAQLPTSTVQPTHVHFRGSPVNFAGDREYQPWSVSVYSDGTFAIRTALETWQDGIKNFKTSEGTSDANIYQVDMTVEQLGLDGGTIKTYKFYDAFPSSISAIQLDFESGSQAETFDVEFTYNYHEPI